MDEDRSGPKNLVDTTDCLEAVGVFRVWKNGLFIIIVLCLLLQQVSFWLVNVGYVKTDIAKESSAVASESVKKEVEAASVPKSETVKIEEAAKQTAADPNVAEPNASAAGVVAAVAAEPNKPVTTAVSQPQPQPPVQPQPQQQPEVQAQPQKTKIPFEIKFAQEASLIRFINFVLIPVTALYCLIMLFGLKVSLMGRLGGINHISRAFFLSLFMFVLLVPWQRFFSGVVVGEIYTPEELSKAVRGYAAFVESWGMFGTTLYYLRFVGYWALVMLLVILAQIRSIRWSKAILRRLEIV